MPDLASEFAKAHKAYQAGELDDVSEILGPLIQSFPNQPALYHMTGLVLKKRGILDRARLAFERGIAINASMPGLHAELASVLADLEEPENAIEAYDRAIALDPSLLDARIDRAVVKHKHINQAGGYRDLEKLAAQYPGNERILANLAIMARALGKLAESKNLVGQLISLSPNNFKARRLEAQLALDQGLPAVELFRAARDLDQDDPAAITGHAAALLGENKQEEAAEMLTTALATRPEWNDGHQFLSQILWQSGQRDAFTQSYRDALQQEPRNLSLWSDMIVATARGLGHDHALPLYKQARATIGENQHLDNLEANSLCELGEMERAGQLYEKLKTIDDPNYRLPYIRYCLKTAQFETAQELGLGLVEQGHGPDAWPYVSIAWRILEDPRWDWLEGARDLAQVFDLEGLYPELPELADHLRSLHRWQIHPFEQSLRGGTQTDNVLLTRDHPQIQSLVRHLRASIAEYIAQLPPHDENHPVLAQPRDKFRFVGSWSVRLTDSGFHVSHIHNQGWISSALYVALPDTLGDAKSQDGWLALGEPPAEFGLDLEPVKLVEPKPGRLALFPSIMWHGTRPFSAGERLTVAFDVAPE